MENRGHSLPKVESELRGPLGHGCAQQPVFSSAPPGPPLGASRAGSAGRRGGQARGWCEGLPRSSALVPKPVGGRDRTSAKPTRLSLCICLAVVQRKGESQWGVWMVLVVLLKAASHE